MSQSIPVYSFVYPCRLLYLLCYWNVSSLFSVISYIFNFSQLSEHLSTVIWNKSMAQLLSR